MTLAWELSRKCCRLINLLYLFYDDSKTVWFQGRNKNGNKFIIPYSSSSKCQNLVTNNEQMWFFIETWRKSSRSENYTIEEYIFHSIEFSFTKIHVVTFNFKEGTNNDETTFRRNIFSRLLWLRLSKRVHL